MQILLHLPDELARRFKASIPPKQRSAFVAALLSKALPEENDALHRLAQEVEQDQPLNTEMADWRVTVDDGLETSDEGESLVAVCDQIRAVDKSRLMRQAGTVSGAGMAALSSGWRRILGLG